MYCNEYWDKSHTTNETANEHLNIIKHLNN